MTVELTNFTTALSLNKEKLLNIGPDDLEFVMKHYNVTADNVAEMVGSIREWLKKQPHLPEDKIKDVQIIGHLMFRGFRVETVKRSLDDYVTARHRMPDIVCQRDPLEPKLAEYIKRGYWVIMPKKTPDNHRVTIFRMVPSNNCLIAQILKIAFMYTDYRIWNEASLGDCWIIDLEGVGLQETLQMTPVMLSNILNYITSCFGARLKSVHIINVPPFAAAVVNLFKMMIRSKLGERVSVTTKENIMKIFPKDCLPVEYNGTHGSCQDIADQWCKTMQSDAWRQFFIEQDSVLTDESKRLTPSADNEIFGAAGSFRAISLD